MNKREVKVTEERVNLSTNLCGFKLRNPILLASGFLGSTGELLKRVAATGVGAVVTKSVGEESVYSSFNLPFEDSKIACSGEAWKKEKYPLCVSIRKEGEVKIYGEI